MRVNFLLKETERVQTHDRPITSQTHYLLGQAAHMASEIRLMPTFHWLDHPLELIRGFYVLYEHSRKGPKHIY